MMEKKKKKSGQCLPALPPPSSPQPSQQILSEESAPPPGISAARNAAREGEGGWRGRGIFDVSLSEAVDFHMVEGGGRACELGWKLGPSFRTQRGWARTSDPQMLAGRVPSPRRAPAPGRASPGHSPPCCWPPPGAPRPPSPSCPPGSPQAGGGNRRPRRDSESQAAGSLGGGAGRGGKERATRCVGQRSSGQSVTSRGAPAGGGAGGRNPFPEASGRGRADCLLPAAGQRLAGVGWACHWAESGASGCAREVSQRSRPGAAWEPEHPGPVPGRQGWEVPRRRWRGGFQECAVGVEAFRI